MNIGKKIRRFLFPDIWRGLSVSLRYALGIGSAQKIPPSSGAPLRLPVVDPDRCAKCKLCVKICPARAISVQTVFQKRPEMSVDKNKCVSCGLCAEACPKNAITFEGK